MAPEGREVSNLSFCNTGYFDDKQHLMHVCLFYVGERSSLFCKLDIMENRLQRERNIYGKAEE